MTAAALARRSVRRRAGAGRLRVLTFSSLFPNAEQPLHGLFVRERVRAMAEWCDVRVIAPVPFVPPLPLLGDRYARLRRVSALERWEGLDVRHPRFVVTPKVGKAFDGIAMGLSCLADVAQAHRALRFDIIDAHWAYPDGVAAAVIAKALGLPLSITVRGDDINVFAEERLRRPSIKWALRRADLVVAVSAELRERVAALGVESSRIVMIPNGVDTRRFQPMGKFEARIRLGLRLKGPLLLSVGRLHESKRFPVLVDVLARIRQFYPDASLAIVGGSDSEADATQAIVARARALALTDEVHLPGAQSPDTLPLWYGASDVFCMPSSREGSPNVLLEALACGVPSVATRVGGAVEVVTDPSIGQLAPGDAESFTAAVRNVLSARLNRDAIARRAQRRTWSAVGEECCRALATACVAEAAR